MTLTDEDKKRIAERKANRKGVPWFLHSGSRRQKQINELMSQLK